MSGIEEWFDRERGERRVRQCRDKRAFLGEAEARATAAADRARYGDRLYPYRCEICGDWHLTHSRPGGGQADRQD